MAVQSGVGGVEHVFLCGVGVPCCWVDKVMLWCRFHRNLIYCCKQELGHSFLGGGRWQCWGGVAGVAVKGGDTQCITDLTEWHIAAIDFFTLLQPHHM